MAWTVSKSINGRYNPHLNHSSNSFYCMFDYTISPEPENNSFLIELGKDPDKETMKWYPHLRDGLIQGYQEALKKDRSIISIRIEIKKIFSHPVDTTVKACWFYGKSFILSTVWDNLSQMEE